MIAIDVSADGNCFYHALSVCLYGHKSKHVELRHQIAQHMVNNINLIFADICSSAEDWVLFRQFAESTYEDDLWAGENLIKAAANFLQREIRVLLSSKITLPLSYTPMSKSYARVPTSLGLLLTRIL